MSNLIVHGGTPLSGRIVPSANKNAVLPILCATLLTQEPVRLVGIPEITDVKKILEIFRQLGSAVSVDYASGILELHHQHTQFDPQRHHLPEEMRSSIMLVPGLLARFGVARIENDVQGCTLGVREIDPHVEVMERFGAAVERRREALIMRVEGGLKPNHHWLDYASVTTTENFVLCAALAGGTSTLMNAASEPHVQEFCSFMALLGAQIEGIGTSRLTVHGVG
jgi:UDP-N-acetylglucosamine 1-carboxyvinyltransferase